MRPGGEGRKSWYLGSRAHTASHLDEISQGMLSAGSSSPLSEQLPWIDRRFETVGMSPDRVRARALSRCKIIQDIHVNSHEE